MIFQLRKPRYEWRVLPRNPDGSSNGSQVVLAQEVENWLAVNGVTYDTWSQTETRPGPPAPPLINPHGVTDHQVLVFYINIEDANHALLFKLTWM